MEDTKISGSVPVRSREGLTRCVQCRRHIQAASTPATSTCPFCTSKTPRSARGGLLASALLAVACGSAEPEVSEPQTNSDTVQTETAEDTPAETPNETAENGVDEPSPPVPAVPAYGIAPQPPQPPPDEPEAEESDEPDETAEEFQPEPAPAMRPMARYGRVPMRRPADEPNWD